MDGLNGIPILYDHKNIYNSRVSPSTVHAKNTALSWFFYRYLMQKIFSVYEFDLPDEWDRDYFLYTIFTIGFGGVLATDKYGTIFQHGTLSGYNIYYRPTTFLVSNPALKQQYRLLIGEQTELIKLTPDYMGAFDIVQMYGDMMAVTMESFGVNAINSKFAFVFMADNKTMAESMKKLYDQVASGEPAAFADKKLFDQDGNPKWNLFLNNLKQNYIGLELLESLTTIEDKFSTMVGIDNANVNKRERMLVDEVNANNQNTKALAQVWLECLKESFDKVNDMFGLDLSVRLRKEASDGIPVSDGSVSVRSDDI